MELLLGGVTGPRTETVATMARLCECEKNSLNGWIVWDVNYISIKLLLKQKPKLDCGNGYTAAAAKSLQLCPTLCDPIDGSSPGCPVPGILQARILEWVAISVSNAWKWKVKVNLLSHVGLLASPWTLEWVAIAFTGFSLTCIYFALEDTVVQLIKSADFRIKFHS